MMSIDVGRGDRKMSQLKKARPSGDLYYRDCLDDFRKRALWSVYRLYNWMRLFSVIGFVFFVTVVILTAQVAATGPESILYALTGGIGVGLATAFGVAAFFARHKGRKLESRVEEFKNKHPYPEWKAGKFRM